MHIRGLGIDCALGRDLDSCTRGLSAAEVRTTPLSITALAEPVTMPYYRVPDELELFDRERYFALSLRAARNAIASASLSPNELHRTALFIGTSCFAADERDESTFGADSRRHVGLDPVANRIAAELALGGDIMLFNTACTASAVAMLHALRWIRLGLIDNALVMGVEICNRTTPAGFAGLQLVSDVLRPFDRRRGGIVLGEGVGAVVLSRTPGPFGLKLLGGATILDHFSVTTANPDGSSIERVQRAALASAGVDANEILGIKAHGTASPMNDSGEAAGILRVFATPPPVCGLKPYVGHTLGACGVIELALLGGALGGGFFPATPGFAEADPELGLVPTREAREAKDGAYLLNYFGFGGNNTSLVLERS